ncbi:uncharacterized protein LOC115754033 [Rhodamnia argentea]|uniref:Uncharacterized protein LOC115754033 n=1 Tax=Rhodamnia argentea TaxID=178133 RepID=A0A8B8QNN7_9MYRT|nr:uncharacterized protein LOC115754033 [Rhodamnia argentea]
MEESSNATEDLLDSETSTEENSSSNLVRKGSNMADFSLQRWWVEHEDNQINIEGNSSNEREGVQDCQTSTEEDSSIKLVHKGLNMADFSIEKHRYSVISLDYRNVRPEERCQRSLFLLKTIPYVSWLHKTCMTSS